MLHSLNSGQHKPSALFDSSLALSEIPINWPKCLQGVFVWECGENAIMFSSLCLDVLWVLTSSISLCVWEVVKLYFNGSWTISQHPQSVLMMHDILHADVMEKEMPNDAVWRTSVCAGWSLIKYASLVYILCEPRSHHMYWAGYRKRDSSPQKHIFKILSVEMSVLSNGTRFKICLCCFFCFFI